MLSLSTWPEFFGDGVIIVKVGGITGDGVINVGWTIKSIKVLWGILKFNI